MKNAEIEAEIEDFLEGFNQPTYRGMRVDGVRVQWRRCSGPGHLHPRGSAGSAKRLDRHLCQSRIIPVSL
jgi:hypothetical protein